MLPATKTCGKSPSDIFTLHTDSVFTGTQPKPAQSVLVSTIGLQKGVNQNASDAKTCCQQILHLYADNYLSRLPDPYQA